MSIFLVTNCHFTSMVLLYLTDLICATRASKIKKAQDKIEYSGIKINKYTWATLILYPGLPRPRPLFSGIWVRDLGDSAPHPHAAPAQPLLAEDTKNNLGCRVFWVIFRLTLNRTRIDILTWNPTRFQTRLFGIPRYGV